MKQVGIFYGSSSGDTERVATIIYNKIGTDRADLHNILESKTEDLETYSQLIFGISTWGIGKMQEDWADFLPELNRADFQGKKIALFGLGDQESYPDTFADGLGKLYNLLYLKGYQISGSWDTDGYNFISSGAIKGGKFVGLIIDEINQPELTESRIDQWLKILGF